MTIENQAADPLASLNAERERMGREYRTIDDAFQSLLERTQDCEDEEARTRALAGWPDIQREMLSFCDRFQSLVKRSEEALKAQGEGLDEMS